jgi:hypothetical protein
MRFRIRSRDTEALLLVFEPSGAEYTVAPGDYVTIEWPDGPGGLLGGIDYEPGSLTISEPGNGLARIWTSQGEELSILG